MAERRVAITRRVPLAEYSDGWDECYAIVTLADFDEVREISTQDFKNMNNLEIVAYEQKIVMKHFVSGKILLLDDDNQSALSEMTAADIKASSRIIDALFSVIMGVTLDPKDTSTAAPPKIESTETSNSTKIT